MTSTGSVSFQGLVSGLNVSSIITALESNSQTQITQLQSQGTTLQNKASAWSSFQAALSSYQTAAFALNSALGPQALSVNSSNSSLVSATVTGTPLPGTTSLIVNNLASNEQDLSNGYSDPTASVLQAGTLTLKSGIGSDDHNVTGATALSFLNNGSGVAAGSITINDRSGATDTIDLSSAKTIQDVLNTINNDHAIKVSAQLNSNGTGIQITDRSGSSANPLIVTGGIASALGIDTGSGGVVGTKVVGTALDPKYTITLDASHASLQEVASAINNLGGPFSASIINDGGTNNNYHLSISGSNTGTIGALSLSDSAGDLAFSKIQNAQDAKVLVGATNPTAVYSHTNQLSSLIPGVQLTLGNADPNTTVTLSSQSNNTAAVTAIQNFIGAFNNVVSFANQQNAFNTQTGAPGGPLFGDSTLNTVVKSLHDALINPISGLPSTANSLFQVGLQVNSDGSFGVDQAKLGSALTTNAAAVQNIFLHAQSLATLATASASGTASGYDAATLTNGVTSSAQFGTGQGWESATAVSPGAPATVTLNLGGVRSVSTLTINTLDSVAQPASQYGISDFLVQYLTPGSNPAQDASWVTSATISGNTKGSVDAAIGTATAQVRLKITGTNAADGLARLVQITPNSRNGIADQAINALNSITNAGSGAIASQLAGLNSQQYNITQQIAQVQFSLTQQTAQLTAEFNNMESVLARLQSQSTSLNTFLNQVNGTTSSSSSSSSLNSHLATG